MAGGDAIETQSFVESTKILYELVLGRKVGYLPFRMTRLTLVLLFVALAASAQNPEVNRYLGEARKAIADKDYPAAYEALHKAQQFHPYHQAILYKPRRNGCADRQAR